jgi:hypothetical protein
MMNNNALTWADYENLLVLRYRSAGMSGASALRFAQGEITAPGSRRENGDYILHGDLNEAPPLYGLIIDAVGQAKAERSKPCTKAAVDNWRGIV